MARARRPPDTSGAFARAAAPPPQRYVLRLFVAGNTATSQLAISQIRSICEGHLRGRYDLEVLDVRRHPEEVAEARIIATPTLLKNLPLPLRRLVGDLSATERILVGLDLRVKGPAAS